MKSKFILAIFAFCLVIFSSCEYQPTGSNFKNIDSTYNIPTIIIELPEEGKPIYVSNYESYKLKYKLDGDLSKFMQVLFYYDTTLLYQSENKEGMFELSKKTANEKEEHNLKMLILNTSGTGSLADIMQLEGSYIEKNWPLIVANPDYFTPDSLKSSVVDGVLKIEWNTYDYSNFIYYYITKVFYDKEGYRKHFTFSPIVLRDVDNFIDITYAGEKANYYLTVHYRKNNSEEYIKYPILNLDDELPKFSYKKLTQNSIEVNWNKGKYYGGIDGYVIQNNNLSLEIPLESNVYKAKIENLPIGANEELIINIIPNLKKSEYNPIVKLQIMTGDSSFNYWEMEKGNDDYIFFSQNIQGFIFNLYKYSISSNSILQSTEFHTLDSKEDRIIVSPNGKNMVYRNDYNLICCLNGDLENPVIVTDVSFHGSQSAYGFSDMALSNNGILATCLPHERKVGVYDLNKMKLISCWNEDINNISISGNGKYVAVYSGGNEQITKIYEIKEDSCILIISDFLGLNMKFDDNSNLYYFDYGDKITKYINCETKEITNILNSRYNQIDLESGLAIIEKSENNYEIVDIKNGGQRIYNYYSINGSGQIKGNYIYFGTGVKCKFR